MCAFTVDGEVVIPIDVEAFGFWLKAALGQPTTAGTTPKTHTFQSGNWTLPSMAVAVRMDEANGTPRDYYLLPSIDMTVGRLKLAEQNGLSLDAYRFETLDFFYSLASRARISEGA